MKKFSWIFALILALSIGFIGCPAADDDDDSGGGGGGGDFSGPTKAISFGTGSGQVEVFKNGTNNDGSYDPGTLIYVDGGYKYTYTSASNYGNSILRFKVNLGETALGDYQAVQFDFQAEGFKDDTDPVVSNKKIFLLATKNEDDIKPYKNDTVPGAVGSGVVPLIISTDYFDNSPHTGVPSTDNPDKLYAAALQPTLNGTGKITVTLPIVKSLSYMGETWFALYIHAGSGSYTISNFKFGADPATGTDYGPDAPNKPLPTGEPNAWFYLDLSTITTVTGTVGGVPDAVTPVWNATDKTLTATFSGAGRLNVDLSTAQLTALKARAPVSADATDSGNNINVIVKGRLVSVDTDQDKFRYSIGDASIGSSWATWHPVGGNSAFASIMGYKHWVAYANQGAEPKNFILNYQGSGAAVVEIISIRIEFENGANKGEIASSSNVKGINEITFTPDSTDEVTDLGGATVSYVVDNGFTLETTRTSWDVDEPMGAAVFKVTLPTGYTLGQYTNLDITFVGSSGDIGYKRVFLNILPGDATPDVADIINWTDAYNATTGCTARVTANNGSGNVSVTRNMNFLDASNTNIPKFTALKDETEVYFIIYIWSTAASWEFSDIRLY